MVTLELYMRNVFFGAADLRQVVKTVKPNTSHTWIMSLKLLWLSFGLSETIKQCGMCIQAWSFSASTAPRDSMLIRPAALLRRYYLSFLLQGMRYRGVIPLVLPLPLQTVGNAGWIAICRLLLAHFWGRNRQPPVKRLFFSFEKENRSFKICRDAMENIAEGTSLTLICSRMAYSARQHPSKRCLSIKHQRKWCR